MSRKHIKIIFFLFIFSSLFFIFYLNFTHSVDKQNHCDSLLPVSVLLRQIDHYATDAIASAKSFDKALPGVPLWIVYHEPAMPPLYLELPKNSSIKLYSLSHHLTFRKRLSSEITTKYVILAPDSVRLTTRKPVDDMIEAIEMNPDSLIAVPIGGYDEKNVTCMRINVNQREWTVKYHTIKGGTCDGITGKHLVIMKKDVFDHLFDPFFLPIFETMYVQSAANNIKVNILKLNSVYNGKMIYKPQKRKRMEQESLRKFYKQVNIKRVIRETGKTEWYGCTKETPRCFGEVLENTPSYLLEGKWTPPCCLSNLRKTALHVFSMLDEVGVRYWLDSGSLLGAMRSGDILPWDYNVDIGIFTQDLNRCKWLKKSQSKPIVDKKGFFWEKEDNNIFKISYSKVNKIQVNIVPFNSKNGSMVKDSSYGINRGFPESFLHPMSSIDFLGRSVPSPNNIRDFLEMKYGKGCIEKPEYPQPKFVKFPS